MCLNRKASLFLTHISLLFFMLTFKKNLSGNEFLCPSLCKTGELKASERFTAPGGQRGLGRLPETTEYE